MSTAKPNAAPQKTLGEVELLSAVLASPDILAGERGAFESMRRGLGRWSALTLRQRQWLEEVAARIGVLAGGARPLPPRPRRSAWDPA